MTEDKSKGIFRKAAKTGAWLIFGLFLTSLFLMLFLRFAPPVASAFMVEKYCKDLISSHSRIDIQYHWVDWKHISPHMAMAAVAAEDQTFPKHFGFDFKSMADAIEKRKKTGRLRGASTITQQTVKNLFLWNGRSFVRKGLEAYLTLLTEILWPKRRILEVYLNIAEFGDGIYGVEAAAQRYFRKPASALTKRESALLAAVLPNPIQLKAATPSAYVIRRAWRIEKQMRNLGQSCLQGIWSKKSARARSRPVKKF